MRLGIVRLIESCIKCQVLFLSNLVDIIRLRHHNHDILYKVFYILEFKCSLFVWWWTESQNLNNEFFQVRFLCVIEIYLRHELFIHMLLILLKRKSNVKSNELWTTNYSTISMHAMISKTVWKSLHLITLNGVKCKSSEAVFECLVQLLLTSQGVGPSFLKWLLATTIWLTCLAGQVVQEKVATSSLLSLNDKKWSLHIVILIKHIYNILSWLEKTGGGNKWLGKHQKQSHVSLLILLSANHEWCQSCIWIKI